VEAVRPPRHQEAERRAPGALEERLWQRQAQHHPRSHLPPPAQETLTVNLRSPARLRPPARPRRAARVKVAARVTKRWALPVPVRRPEAVPDPESSRAPVPKREVLAGRAASEPHHSSLPAPPAEAAAEAAPEAQPRAFSFHPLFPPLPSAPPRLLTRGSKTTSFSAFLAHSAGRAAYRTTDKTASHPSPLPGTSDTSYRLLLVPLRWAYGAGLLPFRPDSLRKMRNDSTVTGPIQDPSDGAMGGHWNTEQPVAFRLVTSPDLLRLGSVAGRCAGGFETHIRPCLQKTSGPRQRPGASCAPILLILSRLVFLHLFVFSPYLSATLARAMYCIVIGSSHRNITCELRLKEQRRGHGWNRFLRASR
jgi:hypothetical protein